MFVAPVRLASLTKPLNALSVIALLGCALLGSSAAAQEPIVPTDRIALFNGTDLTGWYTWLKDTQREDPRKVFTVRDGLLHISGDGFGCVTTNQAYRNYHLVAEFKWGPRTWHERAKKARDSGILVHSYGADGAYNGIWMRSIETQIIEGGYGDFIVVSGGIIDPNQKLSIKAEVEQDRDMEWVWHEGGEKREFLRGRVNWFGRDPDWKDELGFRGKQEIVPADAEWIRMDVICRDDSITNLVNGVVVNHATEANPSTGKIQIQAELAEIFFRRIELYPLGKAPKFR
ncbi:MAG: DUF1080 domain-containing protein [Planctomycetia bacterium]|nr:DUF1080 domain-containing protein [Planctomycetia bacterium]